MKCDRDVPCALVDCGMGMRLDWDISCFGLGLGNDSSVKWRMGMRL